MTFTKVAPAGIGTNPGTSIRIGDSLLHSTGIDIGTGSGIGVTIRQHGNATFTGIVTAASFSGNATSATTAGTVTTAAQPNITSVGTLSSLNVSGNLGVGGVLTYEDVTNVDSVGVVTARSGIKIGPTAGVAGTFFADGSYVTAGIITATTFHGDGSNLTGLGDSDKIEEGNSSVEVIDTGTGKIDLKVDGSYTARFQKVNGNRTYMLVGNPQAVSNDYGINSGHLIVLANSGSEPATLRLFGWGAGSSDGTINNRIDFASHQSGSGGQTFAKIETVIRGSNDNSSDMTFHTAASATVSERLRIKSNGYVGIGTENPQRPLAVTSGTSGVTAEFNVPDNAPTGSAGLSLNIVNRSNSGYAPLSFNATLYTFGNSGTEKVRIDNNGRLLIGTTTEGSGGADELTIATSGDTGMTIRSGTSSAGGIYFSDGTSGADEYRGVVNYNHSGNYMRLYTDGTERLRITSSGQIRKAQESTVTSLKTYNSNADAFWLSHYEYQSSGTYQRYTDIVSIGDGTWGSNIRIFTSANGSANGIERLRIDSGGRLVIGHTAAPYNDNDKLQVVTSSGGTGIVVDEYSADAWGPSISMLKSRNASIGGNTVVQNGDRLADFNFYGNDGAGRALGAQIGVRVDGTPGSDDMPSRIVFATSADGSQSPTERLSIKSDGKIIVPTTGKLSLGTSSPVAQFTAGTANGSRVIEIQGTDGVIRGYDRNSSAWAQIAFEGASYSFDCGGTERWKINTYGETVTEESSHGWSTYEMHAKDGGTRFHYRGIGAGSSGVSINLIRVRRHYWGSGWYHIKLRQRYYNGSAEGHWWLHGHGRNTGGHSPSWQLNHTNHNNLGGSKVQITSNSNSSPGNDYSGFVDVYANIGAYEYYEVVIETSLMAGYNHGIANVGNDSYALHPF